MAKFFDLKVQSAKEILRFEKKGTSFFVLLSTFRNFVVTLKDFSAFLCIKAV